MSTFCPVVGQTIAIAVHYTHSGSYDRHMDRRADGAGDRSSRRQLKIWRTGTSGDVMEVQYQLIGLHSTEQASSFLGPFHPWVSGYTGSSEGLSDAERDYGFFSPSYGRAAPKPCTCRSIGGRFHSCRATPVGQHDLAACCARMAA